MCHLTTVGSPPGGDGGVRRRAEFPRAWFFVWILALCAAHPQGSLAAQPYLLDVGDALEFSVAGVPSLQRRLVIDIDGNVGVPLVGLIRAAGRSVEAVLADLRREIPGKALNLRVQSGAESLTIIDSNEIILSIAEYRPIYVNGDVARPGEIAYRPGISIAQAVALAGGYDVARFRTEDPFLTAAEQRATYIGLWTDYARAAAEVARVRVELGEKKTVERGDVGSIPLPDEFLNKVIELERAKQRQRTEQYERDKDLQARLRKAAADRLNSLLTRLEKEKESAQIDASETSRLTELNQRGVVPITRLVDQRRLGLISSNSALEVGARAEATRADMERAQREVLAIDERRRLELTDSLQAALTSLQTIQAKLQSTGEKLLYSSTVRSKLVRGSGGQPIIVLKRREAGQVVKRTVDEDAELQPGDVVDISLLVELDAAAAVTRP